MLNQIRDLLKSAQIEHNSLLEISLPDDRSLYAFEISGSKALDYWKLLNQAGRSHQLRPLLIGNDDALEAFMDHLSAVPEGGPSADELLEKATQVNFENWLARRMEQYVIKGGEWLHEGQNIEGEEQSLDDPDFDDEPLEGNLSAADLEIDLNSLDDQLIQQIAQLGLGNAPRHPSAGQGGQFNRKSQKRPEERADKELPLSLSSWDQHKNRFTLSDRVYCALIQARESYELPIALRYGGSGNSPETAEHAAVIKRWQEQYGAEILGLSSCTLDCLVSKPPLERSAALILARELSAYCPDMIDPVEGLKAYAQELVGETLWSFWWETDPSFGNN